MMSNPIKLGSSQPVRNVIEASVVKTNQAKETTKQEDIFKGLNPLKNQSQPYSEPLISPWQQK
jgi:hypothetical protein